MEGQGKGIPAERPVCAFNRGFGGEALERPGKGCEHAGRGEPPLLLGTFARIRCLAEDIAPEKPCREERSLEREAEEPSLPGVVERVT